MFSLMIELDDFSAAHRLVKGYRGKCNHLHGHNYRLEIVITGDMDTEGDDLLIDFSVVRSICNEWIRNNIDHCTFVYSEDKLLLNFLSQHQQKHYVLPYNTSVERIAQQIYENFHRLLCAESATRNFTISQVQVWESRECSVIYAGNKTQVQGTFCG